MKILCALNMFTYEQPIYILNEDNKTYEVVNTTLSKMSDDIAQLASAHNITKIEINGHTTFSAGLVEQIRNKAKTAYGLSDLDIIIG